MALRWVNVFTVTFLLLLFGHAHAETCGTVKCQDITSDVSVEVINNLMRTSGTDCQSVENVRLLEKSKPGVMAIYDIKCDDGDGIQDYQITHWTYDNEIIIDKFTGEWMDAVTIHY
mgnify:CR=1 FL=1